uniref:Peroxin-13 n=1 Tax=Melanaphis sacchari TaxID=742174 RepID=A0A2H8TZU9_9HEMI
MNDDDQEFKNIVHKSNHLLQNIPTGAVDPGRVAPPISTTPPITTTSPPPLPPHNTPLNTNVPRIQRRTMPTQYAIPNMNTYSGLAGAPYNNYPYRGMASMNMGGFNPYGAYGQLTNGQYQDPIVIAAAESSRPAFESIQAVVQSFNSVSMMLESTFAAMHMSFQALLGVAENFTRLKMFMTKLYSTIITFKLARWFLTKIFYLLRMVRGDRGSSAEEDLWSALSSTDNRQIIPSDGRSWPLVVFSGLLVATPYFVYKLLNSVTPVPNSANSSAAINTLPSNS